MKVDSDICVRKVRALGGRCREQANEMGLDEEDLVIVRTEITPFPVYSLEKIEGNPIEYLQKNLR